MHPIDQFYLVARVGFAVLGAKYFGVFLLMCAAYLRLEVFAQ